ncbi:MAG: hypothetical protein HZB91_03190 [Elusimicrobia bacterium]|nr:hypothetical protein [Elusimicrobiota bacterium]
MSDEPLIAVLRVLDRLAVPYMLTGSYASNLYGRLRSTFDADLVVAIKPAGMKALVAALAKGFYFDAETLEEARESGGHFNAIHKDSGFKVDFYLLSGDEYGRVAFRRRHEEKVFGLRVSVISPEDLILAKLRWSVESGSQRQIEDEESRLDRSYLRRWAARLSLSAVLDRVLS